MRIMDSSSSVVTSDFKPVCRTYGRARRINSQSLYRQQHIKSHTYIRSVDNLFLGFAKSINEWAMAVACLFSIRQHAQNKKRTMSDQQSVSLRNTEASALTVSVTSCSP